MKDRVITFFVFTVLILFVLVANRSCTELQANHCEDSGGESVTRYFDLEYTGCIQNGG